MKTIESPLTRQNRIHGHESAVRTAHHTLTYSELYARTRAAGNRLLQEEGTGNAPVGIFMEHDLNLFLLLHTCLERGIPVAPISTRIPVGHLGSHLKQIDARTLITDDPSRIPQNLDCRLLAAGSLLEATGESSGESSSITLDRPATIVYTSGSTGQPKPALHCYGNHYYSALGSNQNISLTTNDRWLLSLPMYHVGGIAILFRCLLAGATVVIPEDTGTLIRPIEAYDATHVSMVSTQLRRLLANSTGTIDSLQAVLLGGGAVSDALIDEAVARELPLYVSYGLTEMSSQVTTTPAGVAGKRLHSSGRLLPYRQLTTADDGEILVRGLTLFSGYIEGKSLDRSTDSDGWFYTGDLGRLDDEGYLYVEGRKDNMFISGGENIQPEEIETALERIRPVREAIVVPVQDAEFGRRPVAFVRWQNDPQPLELVRERLAPELERYKLPVAIYSWPEDDAHGRMKINRDQLIERAETKRRGEQADA